MRKVSGSVRILRCESCEAKFPVFEHEIESDAQAIGLYSAALCNGKDLLLLELDPIEWNDARTGKLVRLPERLLIDASLRKDYRLTHILRVDFPVPQSDGLSFDEFRKKYRAPTVVYACPCCENGEARSISEVTAREFIESGGSIVALEEITLAS